MQAGDDSIAVAAPAAAPAAVQAASMSASSSAEASSSAPAEAVKPQPLAEAPYSPTTTAASDDASPPSSSPSPFEHMSKANADQLDADPKPTTEPTTEPTTTIDSTTAMALSSDHSISKPTDSAAIHIDSTAVTNDATNSSTTMTTDSSKAVHSTSDNSSKPSDSTTTTTDSSKAVHSTSDMPTSVAAESTSKATDSTVVAANSTATESSTKLTESSKAMDSTGMTTDSSKPSDGSSTLMDSTSAAIDGSELMNSSTDNTSMTTGKATDSTVVAANSSATMDSTTELSGSSSAAVDGSTTDKGSKITDNSTKPSDSSSTATTADGSSKTVGSTSTPSGDGSSITATTATDSTGGMSAAALSASAVSGGSKGTSAVSVGVGSAAASHSRGRLQGAARVGSSARSVISTTRSVMSDEDYYSSRAAVKVYPFSKPIWSDGSWTEWMWVFSDDEYLFGIFLSVLASVFMFVAVVKSIRTEADFTSLSLFGMAVSCVCLIPATRCQGFVPSALLQSPANPHIKKGSLAIVTGSNCGIGKVTAQQLALWGVDVIMAVRNDKAAKIAKADIERYLSVHCKGRASGELSVMALDLSDLESVKAFAVKVLALNRDIHFLINNAGVLTHQMRRTKQGHESMFGTNYLGPFLLSRLLLDNITKANGRILSVASSGHALAPRLNLPHICSMDESKFNGWRMYGYSKTCLLLLTRELARRMTVSKSEGVSASIQPGGVSTSLAREFGFQRVFELYFKNLWEGSQTTLYCCAEAGGQLLSGGYYAKCRPGVFAKDAMNLDSAQELWAWSEKACADYML